MPWLQAHPPAQFAETDNPGYTVATTVRDCRLIELPRVYEPRGNLTFIEGGVHIPFEIRRVYYLYDVPGGASRAGHGHRELQQLIIAMSGSFTVVVDDARERQEIRLNRSYFGLYIPTMIWREIVDFSSGAVCTVLASTLYDEADYFREYSQFAAAKGAV